jgi:hypothetical protein
MVPGGHETLQPSVHAMIANARQTKISAVQRVFPLMFTWSR